MSKKALVSVIIPTYNRKTYVQEAINSALEQTYPHKEIIVVDDGSTDGTGPLLKSKYGDYIQYYYQNNRGEAAARNKGVLRSKGNYIAFLDSDDVWMPAKLEKQIDLLEIRPEFGLVSCHVLVIDETGKFTRETPLRPEQTTEDIPLETLVLNNPIYPGSTILIRRDCFLAIDGFDESIRYGEDRDLILRIAANNKAGFVLEPLAALRFHKDMQSRILLPEEELRRRTAERIRIIKRAFFLFECDEQWLASLKSRALAKEHVHESFIGFLYDDPSLGASRLALGVSLDPTTWRDGEKIAGLVSEYSAIISQDWSLTQALDFVDGVYSHLPGSLQFWHKKYHSKILSNTHITYAFLQYKRGEKELVGANVLKGVYNDPRWLSNRGVWSIFIRSAF
jgi:glycosyltransferase involved in cell wall biosynthesis